MRPARARDEVQQCVEPISVPDPGHTDGSAHSGHRAVERAWTPSSIISTSPRAPALGSTSFLDEQEHERRQQSVVIEELRGRQADFSPPVNHRPTTAFSTQTLALWSTWLSDNMRHVTSKSAVLAIDVGGTKMAAAIVDTAGRPVEL